MENIKKAHQAVGHKLKELEELKDLEEWEEPL